MTNLAASFGKFTANGVYTPSSSNGVKYIRRTGAGVYEVIFEQLMPHANYIVNVSSNVQIALIYAKTKQNCTIKTYDSSFAAADAYIDVNILVLPQLRPKNAWGT